jgi:hypothetical protein
VNVSNAAVNGIVRCGGGLAFDLENAKTGAVYLNTDKLNRAFTAEGQVRLRNAESGTVDCNGGKFINPGMDGIALNLENAKTGIGRPEDAVEVMVAKNKDAGKNSISEAWKAKGGDLFWYKAFGKLICFGYNPWPALHLSLLLVLLGAVLFELGFRSRIVIPTDVDAYYPGTVEIKDTYPKFNALIYSLETSCRW